MILRASRLRPACLLLVLAACARSPSEDVRQQTGTAAASAATALMVLDAWRSDAAPAHYARRTCESMRRQLREAAEEIGRTGVPQARRATAAIRAASEAIGDAETALSVSDRAAVERSRQAIASAALAFGGPPSPKQRP